MESLLELKSQVFAWRLLLPFAALVVLVAVGSGFWNTRWKRAVWLAGLGVMGAALVQGLLRGEWGDVLFHGNIL